MQCVLSIRAGRVIRLEEQNPARRVLVAVIEGRRQRGRPKLRWEGGVREDTRKLGERNWRNAEIPERLGVSLPTCCKTFRFKDVVWQLHVERWGVEYLNVINDTAAIFRHYGQTFGA
jgi:hypothetical protein